MTEAKSLRSPMVKRRIAFSSNRRLDTISAFISPSSMNSTYYGSSNAILHDEGTLYSTNSKESLSKIEKTLRGQKNNLPFSDGMFTSFNGEKTGSGLWKELLNFTQGRSKTYAIPNYIISK